jgi:hypothetical protein
VRRSVDADDDAAGHALLRPRGKQPVAGLRIGERLP